MKKVLNLFVICSVLAISSVAAIAVEETQTQTVDIAKKPEEVHIVKPEKKKKINLRLERKKNEENAKTKKESSKEAEGMYETKFPTINSQIEYSDMNGEVTLVDCIKLAITHHPAIMSAISNAEIYKSRVGQAWSNYFPTLSAGVSYSRSRTRIQLSYGRNRAGYICSGGVCRYSPAYTGVNLLITTSF